MPMSLLYEWLAFQQLEPWGYDVELVRWKQTEHNQFTRTAMLIANLLNGLRGKGNRRVKVSDFIPDAIKQDKPGHKPKPPEEPGRLFQKLKMAFGLVKDGGQVDVNGRVAEADDNVTDVT